MDRPVSLEARRIDLAIEPPFRLGLALVDPPAHEVTIAGVSSRLQPQTLKVLIALNDKAGEVVTRDELTDRCWDGRIVGEDAINRCISVLRRFAHEAGGFQIQTVPRAGYRLLESNAASGARRWGWAASGIAAALVTVATGLYLMERTGGSESSALTVAVLPFAEDSPGRDIHELAAATRASVSNAMAEGGYPAALVDQRSGKHRPDLIVSGDIRRAGSSVQAFVQVEETRHGVVVYAHRFEAAATKPASGLPDQIGASVASSLSWTATLMRLDRDRPSDPAVTATLLKAASFNAQGDDPLRAYDVARRIAPREPNSATAQLSLAFDTGAALDELPRDQRLAAVVSARRAFDRAVVLAPRFGDSSAAWCALYADGPIADCEDQLRKGLHVDPDAQLVPGSLSAVLDGVGRIDDALQFAELALANDPYKPGKLALMIRILEEKGDERDASRLFNQAMRWWPNHPAIVWNRLVGIEFRGDYAALEKLESEVGDDLPLDRRVTAELVPAIRAHDRLGALRACNTAKMRWTTQSLCMTALADLGEMDRALAIAVNLFPPAHPRNAADAQRMWLDQPGGFALAALSAPAAVSLRRDPRFLDLADGSGLLQYWRTGRLPDFCRNNPEPVCAQIVGRRV